MEDEIRSSPKILRKKIRGKILEINLENLKHNIEFIKSKTKSKVFPVVKSNAYGHGIDNIVPAIDKYIDGWCVGTLEEAERVRKFSKKEIIVLKGISSSFSDISLKQNNIKIVTRDKYDLKEKIEKGFDNILIKLDTGMGRLGIIPKEVPQILNFIERRDNKELIKGVISHFAFSDFADIKFIKEQIELFKKLYQKIESILGRRIMKSIANSAGTLYLGESHFDFVRPGICIYGISPFGPDSHIEEIDYFKQNLKPILSIKAEVIAVKQIEKGWSVGYSRKFLAQSETNVAVIGVGYADGIPRAWWEKGYVSFKGKRLKIIGLISMDTLCVECNGVGINPQDEVEILGNISAYEIASATGTIPYEILCNMGTKES